MDFKPAGYQNVILNMTLKDSKAAVKLYEQALGVTDVNMMESNSGWVMHGNMKLGECVIFFNDESEYAPRKAPKENCPVAFFVYVPDVDAAYEQAVSGGMKSVFEPVDMFWGDRTAVVEDPYHYAWTFATKVADLSKEEIARRQKQFFASS